MKYKIIKYDSYLASFEDDIALRVSNFQNKEKELVGEKESLVDFANGYEYFGIHKTKSGWVYREWAPNAEKMFFTGDFNNWDTYALPMQKLDNGVFEVKLSGKAADIS